MTDPINPSHYQFSNGAQVIDITENLSFSLGNVVKYVARAGRKSEDPLEDLLKARFYLEREIALVERRQQYESAWDALLDAEDAEVDELAEGLYYQSGIIWRDKDGSLWRLDGATWLYFDEVDQEWISVVGPPSNIYEPFKETDLWLNE